ncbi:hypothetical protein ANSO36C_42830 [Nostoc cf. commune SO-36]|uniref:Uncharacterized protein n=1 Tax=Nostoc cf. commune SO-36 TaxID=449208 RepID=A0ABM7Z5W2_NOSCO|nr:hypothetical protein ANSO36C_42830 [Nostoc cf. commune SO-36]
MIQKIQKSLSRNSAKLPNKLPFTRIIGSFSANMALVQLDKNLSFSIYSKLGLIALAIVVLTLDKNLPFLNKDLLKQGQLLRN